MAVWVTLKYLQIVPTPQGIYLVHTGGTIIGTVLGSTGDSLQVSRGGAINSASDSLFVPISLFWHVAGTDRVPTFAGISPKLDASENKWQGLLQYRAMLPSLNGK